MVLSRELPRHDGVLAEHNEPPAFAAGLPEASAYASAARDYDKATTGR